MSRASMLRSSMRRKLLRPWTILYMTMGVARRVAVVYSVSFVFCFAGRSEISISVIGRESMRARPDIVLLIPMRHAARTPPPPDFVACALLR